MLYAYKAKQGPTEIVEGDVDAVSQKDAVAKLEGMGLTPIRVFVKGSAQAAGPPPEFARPAKRAVPEPEPELRAPKASRRDVPRPVLRDRLFSTFARVQSRDVDTFTRQMASLIKASVSVLGSLTLISQQTESKPLKSIVSGLERAVRDGKMLSEAMEKYPDIFDNLYLSMVRSGEKGGVLEETLTRLAMHREREQEIRRRIQAAMAYPALMVIVGIATVFIMLTYFLPKLVGLFENMKQALPLPTKILIALSNFMVGNWYWIAIAVVLVLAVFGRIKSGSKKKFMLDIVKLHAPFIKTFVLNAEIAKFTKTLGLLLASGIPIHDSLKLSTDTLDNDVLKDSLYRVSHEIIADGSTLRDGLQKIDVFPKFAANMIAVGEQGGKLEGTLAEISTVYDREVDQAITIATALLEPILILIVGAVVGFIVFAMLMPIFNIGIMGS